MAHADLTASSSISLAALGAARTYSVLGGDATTKIVFYVADSAAQSSGTPLLDGRDARRNTLRLLAGQQATFTDSSTFVGYTLAGTAPTAVMVDGPGLSAAIAATTGALGSSQMSVTPAVAGTPIAVGTNDARVNTIDFPLSLSGTDGTLAEVTVWRAPYAGTFTGAFVTSSVTMAANNTDFDTFTLANRPLAGPGTPANIAVTTTKTADLNALVAYVEKSMATSALTNTAFLAGDLLTFKSVIGGAGKASGPGLLRVTYSVP